jgi:ubiquinone/menaquinone biosynthesis C-methylase UbiE
MNALFDTIASDYDAWYDQPVGRAILAAELDCLRRLVGCCRGRWLEVGVGTGRFAIGLGIGEGIDPAANMLQIAARRGVRTYLETADSLPFPEGSFDGVLLALTLCFIEDPAAALRECRRVISHDGVLLVGIVPAVGAALRTEEGRGLSHLHLVQIPQRPGNGRSG